MLLASELIIERVSLRRFALAGLVATALQLSGHPESQFHVGALTGLYVLVRVALCNLSLAERSVRILLCAGAQIVGLLGAAVSIVPLAEQLRESADWHESTHALERHLPLAGLIGVIAPDHFGRPRAGRFYYGPLNYNEAGLYVGLAPLALALTEFFALLYQPRRTRRGAAGAASVIFAVWLVLCSAIVFGVPGTATFLRHVPLFSKADNLRLILGLQFSLAMLSGIAWAHLTENLGRFRAVSLTVICVAITILLGTLMFVQGSTDLYSHIEGIRKLWTDATVPAPWEHRSLRTLMSVLVAALVTLWSVWHWLHARRARWSSGGSTSLGTSRPARPDRHSFELPSKLLVGCLIAITVGDLCWVAYDFTPIVPSRVVFPNAPESLRRIADNLRGGRLAATDEILSPNLAMVYGLRDFRGYDFPLDRNWTMLFRKLGWKSGITLCPRDQLFPCIPPVLQSVADKCCIRFFFTAANSKTEPAPAVLPVCDLVDEINDLQPWILVTRGIGPALDLVYQNPTAYPRAYFARRVLVTDPETALDAMLNVSHDLRQQSFVEHQIEDISGAADQSGTATIERDAAEEVWVRTESSSPALLVLSDRYDPNWQVEIDGSPATMLRTNYLFRGVVVPAGEHLVRWSYRPASFRFGRAVSAMTVCALVGLLFVPSRRSVS